MLTYVLALLGLLLLAAVLVRYLPDTPPFVVVKGYGFRLAGFIRGLVTY